MSSKCLPFNISFGNREKSLGLDPVNREGVSPQFTSEKLPHRQCRVIRCIGLMQDPWVVDNHTEVSAHCCHGKHTVLSSRTLLSVFLYHVNCYTDSVQAVHYYAVEVWILLALFDLFVFRWNAVHKPVMEYIHSILLMIVLTQMSAWFRVGNTEIRANLPTHAIHIC
jgi:hypothetical protein